MLTFLIVLSLVASCSLATNSTDGNLTTTNTTAAISTVVNLTSSSTLQQPVTTYPFVISFPPGIQPAEQTTTDSSPTSNPITSTESTAAASTRRLPIIVIITSNDEIRPNKNPCPLESPCEQLEVQSLTVSEPWEGCLFSAETVIIDGILTIDIPFDTLMSNPSLCLFDTPNPPDGHFTELNLSGVPTCVDANSDYREHGYNLNLDDLSCTSASAVGLKFVF
jgi:hypothetical protein